MAFLVLGLLMIRSLTIYDIKTTLEKKISPFYAASYGSIQAAVRKLLKNGHVTFTEKVENGRNKKEYAITPAGEEAFFAWMREDFAVNKFNDETLVKVFFFGFISRDERVRLLSDYIQRMTGEYEEMSVFQRSALAMDIPAEHKDIYNYQMASLDYGVQAAAYDIQWYQSLLAKIQKEEI
jgi:DNA-binding PadR family transcriptional regulator